MSIYSFLVHPVHVATLWFSIGLITFICRIKPDRHLNCQAIILHLSSEEVINVFYAYGCLGGCIKSVLGERDGWEAKSREEVLLFIKRVCLKVPLQICDMILQFMISSLIWKRNRPNLDLNCFTRTCPRGSRSQAAIQLHSHCNIQGYFLFKYTILQDNSPIFRLYL